MKQSIVILLLIVSLLALPLILRDETVARGNPDATVVVITPHNESIREEFARGFARWYRERTGKTVYLDYRVIGGTSEIARFLESEYTNAFRLHWTRDLGRSWSREVELAFANPAILPGDDPARDTVAEAARRAFLQSSVSSGIDVFFGGGSFDFSTQARRGMLVDAGLLRDFPQWFTDRAEPGTLPAAIPRTFAGETYYDREGRWYGLCLASYGIIFNRPALRRLGINGEPSGWADLTDPRLFGQVAVCDPTMSGSMTQAFEMIVQQQMQRHLDALLAEHPLGEAAELEHRAVEEGWLEGLRLVQIIAANARYFTDSAQKPNIDVAMGDCAVGMSIDFYGRFQQDSVRERSGENRMGIVIPLGGTTISADPIGLLRGARNQEAARLFLEFTLSLEGQKLWNFQVGEAGGPQKYALRRPPIRPELYLPEWNARRSDPGFKPYEAAADFTYRAEWTGRLFNELRTIIRIAFIDVRPELTAAWAAILKARSEGRIEDADRAYAVFSRLDPVDFNQASTTIKTALRSAPLEEVRLTRELSAYFREQFRAAEQIAHGQPKETL